MLSQDFASALREIRNQMQTLVRQNEQLQRQVDELEQRVEKSDERVFRQQSKRIRQAALAGDSDALETLSSNAPSVVDAELIRLSQQAQPVDVINFGTPNNALLAGMIQAHREGRLIAPARSEPQALTSNIEKAMTQLKTNSVAMTQESLRQKELDKQRAELERREYLKANNALGTRSEIWRMDNESDF